MSKMQGDWFLFSLVGRDGGGGELKTKANLVFSNSIKRDLVAGRQLLSSCL